jgi:hypothetical protein
MRLKLELLGFIARDNHRETRGTFGNAHVRDFGAKWSIAGGDHDVEVWQR